MNPTGLCMCGCGERTSIAKQTSTRDGTVKGQPVRYVSASHATSSTGAREYREQDDGCWRWLRPLNDKGYGSKYCPRARTCRAAHRVVWERQNGPLPEALHLHHLCGNKACVNPAHLEPVEPQEHGGGMSVRAIRVLVKEGIDISIIAKAFATTSERITTIVSAG